MKRLVIFLVLIVLLGGGGAASWWFVLRDRLAMPEAAQAEAEEGPIYVDVDPVMIPVIRDGRVVQHMSLVLVLQVASEDDRRIADKAMRRLKDAYIKELHGLLSRRFVWERDDIVPFVKKRLLAASDRVVGPGVVDDVLVRGIESRRPRPA